MNIILSIILVIILSGLFISIFYGIYLLFRNNKVYKFRTRIIDLETDKYLAEKSYEKNPYELHDRYTYDEMLYSFKPLKLENWFTKEEVESLLKYETKSELHH